GSMDLSKIEPDLAERWEASPGGLVWTFHLRQGVKFHGNWGEFDGEDVRYSLMRAADPKRSSFSGDFRALDRVEVVSPHEVKVVFKEPVPHVLGLLANYQGGFIVSRKANTELGDKFGAGPIGTGAFMFIEHVTQQHVLLVAHPAYFRGKPQIDKVLYRFIASDAPRELAFSASELDLILGRRDQKWIDRMRASPHTSIDIFRPAEFRTLHLSTRVAPLDDKRVREAIARAINVPRIVEFVGKDIAVPGRSVVPPSYLGETGDGWTYSYDPARAKALLAEAGHAGGVKIKSI